MMTLEEARALARMIRRHFFLAAVSRAVLLALVAVAFLGALLQTNTNADTATDPLWFAAMLAAMLWVALTVFSVRQVRAANQASVYISSGRLDLAEEQLKDAIHLFTLYRTGKLLACHNLAVVAHGQKNYQAAAELCGCVIALRGSVSRSIGRLCRILLADCRLFLGDSESALDVIQPLSLSGSALSLSEQLMLLPIELRCQIAAGDFQQAVASLAGKVRLAELLDARKAALAHALLARACRQGAQSEVAAFLQRRAELYYDLTELEAEYRVLGDTAAEAAC
ncbi:MAG: hypothetical protein JXQ75_06085 [Phycisphaerae bacterium]|nr:hypothetical protein [Phycisphaerae bacterium]